tara:strand:+ start:518 stop:703 length:186 start_codon:yes stop_codon:yes gene_type:complete
LDRILQALSLLKEWQKAIKGIYMEINGKKEEKRSTLKQALRLKRYWKSEGFRRFRMVESTH